MAVNREDVMAKDIRKAVKEHGPRVGRYFTGTAKLFLASSTEVVNESMPTIGGMIDANRDLMQDTVRFLRNPAQSVNLQIQRAMSTPSWKALEKFAKNSFDDLKTGKLYDKGRSRDQFSMDLDAMMDNFGGFDMTGFDENGDWSETHTASDDDFDRELGIAKAQNDADDRRTDATIGAIDASTRAIVYSSKATAQNDIRLAIKQHSQLMSSMTNVITQQATMVKSVDAMATSLLEVQREVHQQTMAHLETITGLLTEIRDATKPKNERFEASKDESPFGVNGELDIRKYVKTVIKRADDRHGISSAITMATGGFGIDQLLELYADNPLQFWSDMIVRQVLPGSLKKQMERTGRNMENFFPALMQSWAARGQRAERDRLGGKDVKLRDLIFGMLGDVAPRPRTGIDTTMRNASEQAMLTNRTVKSIEQVIPMWLSKIYSAITGERVRMYDYVRGQLVDTRHVVANAVHDDNDFVGSMGAGASTVLRMARENPNRFRRIKDFDEFQDFVYQYLNDAARNNRHINPNVSPSEFREGFRYSGNNEEMYYNVLQSILKSMERGDLMQLSSGILSSRNYKSRQNADLNNDLRDRGLDVAFGGMMSEGLYNKLESESKKKRYGLDRYDIDELTEKQNAIFLRNGGFRATNAMLSDVVTLLRRGILTYTYILGDARNGDSVPTAPNNPNLEATISNVISGSNSAIADITRLAQERVDDRRRDDEYRNRRQSVVDRFYGRTDRELADLVVNPNTDPSTVDMALLEYYARKHPDDVVDNPSVERQKKMRERARLEIDQYARMRDRGGRFARRMGFDPNSGILGNLRNIGTTAPFQLMEDALKGMDNLMYRLVFGEDPSVVIGPGGEEDRPSLTRTLGNMLRTNVLSAKDWFVENIGSPMKNFLFDEGRGVFPEMRRRFRERAIDPITGRVKDLIGRQKEKYLGVSDGNGRYAGGRYSDKINEFLDRGGDAKGALFEAARTAVSKALYGDYADTKGKHTEYTTYLGDDGRFISSQNTMYGGAVGALKRGADRLNDLLFGYDDNGDDHGSREKFELVKRELGNAAPSMAIGALGFTGANLAMGLVGGLALPGLLAPLLGAGVSFVGSSERFQEYLFGKSNVKTKYVRDSRGNLVPDPSNPTGYKTVEIESRDGGIMDSSTYDLLHQYVPNVGKGAVAGVIASGLLPFAVNPLVGAFIGSFGGMIKSSDSLKRTLFGDPEDEDPDGTSGLLSRKRRGMFIDFLKKRGGGTVAGMLAGRAAAGLIAATGLLPGGAAAVVGDALISLGSVSGFFNGPKLYERLFGDGSEEVVEEDDPDHPGQKRKVTRKNNGLFGRMFDRAESGMHSKVGPFMDTIGQKVGDWFMDDVLQPLRNALNPKKNFIGKGASKLWSGIRKRFDAFLDRNIGAGIRKFMDNFILNPLKKISGGLVGALGKGVGALLSSPFKAIELIMTGKIESNDQKKRNRRNGVHSYDPNADIASIRRGNTVYKSDGVTVDNEATARWRTEHGDDGAVATANEVEQATLDNQRESIREVQTIRDIVREISNKLSPNGSDPDGKRQELLSGDSQREAKELRDLQKSYKATDDKLEKAQASGDAAKVRDAVDGIIAGAKTTAGIEGAKLSYEMNMADSAKATVERSENGGSGLLDMLLGNDGKGGLLGKLGNLGPILTGALAGSSLLLPSIIGRLLGGKVATDKVATAGKTSIVGQLVGGMFGTAAAPTTVLQSGLQTAGFVLPAYFGTKSALENGEYDRVGTNAVRIGARGAQYVTKIASGAATRILNAGATGAVKSSASGLLAAAESAGNMGMVGAKLIAGFRGALQKFFQSGAVTKVLKILGKNSDEIMRGILSNFDNAVARLGSKAAQQFLKKANWIILLATAAIDFGTGMYDTPIYFGVSPDDATWGMRFAAGAAKAVSGLALGLIPVGWLVSHIYRIVANDQQEAQLADKQQAFSNELAQYNQENGTDLTIQQYAEMKHPRWYKAAWNGIKNIGQTIGDAVSSFSEKVPIFDYGRFILAGDLKGLSDYNPIADISEDDPNAGVWKALAIGGRLLSFIPTAFMSFVHHQIDPAVNAVKTVINYFQSAHERLDGRIQEYKNLSAAGDLGGIVNYPKLGEDEGGSLYAFPDFIYRLGAWVGGVPRWIGNGVSSIVGGIREHFANEFAQVDKNREIYRKYAEEGHPLYVLAAGALSTEPGGIGTAVDDVNKILYFFGGIGKWIGNGVSNVVAGIREKYSDDFDLVDKRKEMFKEYASEGKVVEILNNTMPAGTSFIAYTVDTVHQIGYGIAGAFNAVSNWAQNLFQSIGDKFKWLGDWVTQGAVVANENQANRENARNSNRRGGFGSSSSRGFGGRGRVTPMSQTDPRWANVSNIGDDGCGPTVGAMVASAYGNHTDPAQMDALSRRMGMRAADGGTNPNFFGRMANAFGRGGFGMRRGPVDARAIVRNSAAGRPVVLMGKGGSYGSGTHYLVTDGANGSTVNYVDPYGGGRRSTNIDRLMNNTTDAIYSFGRGPEDAAALAQERGMTRTAEVNVNNSATVKDAVMGLWNDLNLTGKYGVWRSSSGHYHAGADFVPKSTPYGGAPIKSLTEGKVIIIGKNTNARGYYITVMDGNGYQHTYQHLQKMPTLKIGDRVKIGDVIGYMGGTGGPNHSYGNHLHYEVRTPDNPWTQASVGPTFSTKGNTSYLNKYTMDPGEYITSYANGSVKGGKSVPVGSVNASGSFGDGSKVTDSGSYLQAAQEKTRTPGEKLMESLEGMFSGFSTKLDRFLGALSGNGYSEFDSNEDGAVSNDGSVVSMKGSYASTGSSSMDDRSVYNWLTKEVGFTPIGAAGIMGNWKYESSNNAKRVEGDYLKLKSWPGGDTSDYSVFNTRNVAAIDAYTADVIRRTPSVTGVGQGYYYPAWVKGRSKENQPGTRWAGIGLAQWTGPRAYRLMKYAEDRNVPWYDFETQKQFMPWELDNFYPDVKKRVNGQPTASKAADVFLADYEGIPNADTRSQRMNAATEIYRTMTGYGRGRANLSENTAAMAATASNINRMILELQKKADEEDAITQIKNAVTEATSESKGDNEALATIAKAMGVMVALLTEIKDNTAKPTVVETSGETGRGGSSAPKRPKIPTVEPTYPNGDTRMEDTGLDVINRLTMAF